MANQPSERQIIFLVGAVQFVNILDFMIIMPLGPDLARGLGISAARLGLLGGSYTAAAAVTGVLGALFLDRFDRKRALLVALLGLVVGTFLGGFAVGLGSLLLARVVAGLFGGPATSLAIAIVADQVPEARRGKALGAVMGAVSVASVLGVPLGLRLARLWDWRAPFFAVAALGLVVNLLALWLLPALRGHLTGQRARTRIGELLGRPLVRASYLMSATVMMGGFLLLPNLSAYMQYNLGLPRAQLEVLYFVGGACTFASMRGAGLLVDRIGSFRLMSVVAVAMALLIGCFAIKPLLPVPVAFVLFMLLLTTRNVAHSTLASKVPVAAERASFQSLQSATQHLASAAGASLSSALLSVEPGGHLAGMPRVACLSIGFTLLLPVLVLRVERGVRRRAA